VVPEVCRTQNGSFIASSKVLSYGNGSVTLASRSSSTPGISRILIGLCCKQASKRGSIGCSQGFTQILHSAASRTAKAPWTLFLGERNRACVHKGISWRRCLCGIAKAYRATSLDTCVGQQDMSNIVCITVSGRRKSVGQSIQAYEVRCSLQSQSIWTFQLRYGATKRFCQPLSRAQGQI